MIKPDYIEFMCAAYALDKALKALMNSGVINIGITKDENGVLWVSYKNMNYEADNLFNRSPSEFEGYKYPDNKLNKAEEPIEKKCVDCIANDICREGKKVYKNTDCPYYKTAVCGVEE